MNILVTGGTSAVGRVLVTQLATLGHHVTFTYCSHDDVARQLCQPFDLVQMRQVDFTSRESVEALVSEIPTWDVDALVNNAYVGRPLGTHFHRTSLADFTQAYKDNVEPVILITQACVAAMRRKKSGTIVTVGSLATKGLPPAGYSVYAATKACLQQLARSWQSEYARLGIRSEVVLPDFMPTPLHGDLVDHLAEQELRHKSRLLTPDEVAQCIVGCIEDTDGSGREHIITVDNKKDSKYDETRDSESVD